jgi:predicted permease
VTGLAQEVKRAVRSLARRPGSTVVAVLVLALGIGLSGLMFTILHGVYFRGLPIAEPDRVLAVTHSRPDGQGPRHWVHMSTYVDLRDRQTMFSDLVYFKHSQTLNLAGVRAPARLSGALVSADALATLGVAPLLGRTFAEGEDRPGSPPNLILSHGTWQTRFGGDPNVIGREIRVNGEAATVIGVMPKGFAWPTETEAWAPLRVDPLATPRGEEWVSVWGRLEEAATPALARQEMADLTRRLAAEYPEAYDGLALTLHDPLDFYQNRELDTLFGAMAAASLLVLLVACFNVGSMLLARAVRRTREAGLRSALGASRWRTSLPVVAEALALSAAGAGLGSGVSLLTTRVFDEAWSMRPWYIHFEVEWPTLLAIAALTCVTALLASVAPVLHLRRTDINSVLKNESRSTPSRGAERMARLIVGAQVAVSCALLVCALLMVTTLIHFDAADYPFETERLLTARLALNEADYPESLERRAFWAALKEELAKEQSIAAASLASRVSYAQPPPPARPVSIEGTDYGGGDERPEIPALAIAPGYFEALNVELLAGRDFRESDDDGAERVAIVNRPMVERYFRGENPIGRRFREGTSDTLPAVRIVGVVADLHVIPPHWGQIYNVPSAAYYVPVAQRDASILSIVARTRGEVGTALTRAVRDAVARVDPSIPIFSVQTQAEAIGRRDGFFTVAGMVFIGFGVLALFLAGVGLYGVVSFIVAQRIPEMGLRIALGADPDRMIRGVIGQGARQVGVGLALGLLGALALTPVTRLIVHGVHPRNPVVFAAAAAVVLGVAALASWVPARRAASVDPLRAMRGE